MENKNIVVSRSFILFAVTIIGFILRLYKLEFQSLWLDELYTINFSSSRNTLQEVFDYLKKDAAHPSLYYYTLHLIFKITGDSSLSLRFFSCIVGSMMIPVAFQLGKNVFSRKLGLVFSIIICFNPYLIKHSQDGRMYILFALSILVCILYFFKFIIHRKKRDLYFLVVSICAMYNIHFYGYFIAIPLLILVLIENYKNIKLKEYIFIGLILAVSNIVNILIVLNSVKKESFWIKKAAPNFLMDFFNEYTFKNEFILYFVLFLIYYSFTSNHKIEKYRYYLSIIAFSIIAFPLIISYIKLPIILSRHFISLYVIILFLISIGITFINIKYQNFVLIFYVFLSFYPFFYNYRYYYTKVNEDFNSAANYIIDNKKDNFVFMKKEMFNYYMPKNNRIINDSVNGYKAKNLKYFYFIERGGFRLYLNIN